jgi:DNA-binding NtrC family response regulator
LKDWQPHFAGDSRRGIGGKTGQSAVAFKRGDNVEREASVDMNKTILLLASDSVICKAISEALKSKEYFVLTANEISRAEKWVKECTPDLLIVGHYTEGISGHDAAMYLRRLCPGIPVLLVGGLLDDPQLKNREAIRNFEIFPRPYTAAELLDKVQEVLAKHSVRSKVGSSS